MALLLDAEKPPKLTMASVVTPLGMQTFCKRTTYNRPSESTIRDLPKTLFVLVSAIIKHQRAKVKTA